MGEPMARNVLLAGHALSVYNRSEAKIASLMKLGAKAFPNPAGAAVGADVICVMVSGPDDVREMILGAGGVLAGAAKGCIVVDFSTIGPEATVDVQSACEAAGIHFLSAPVTGSRPAAEKGTLTLLIGGNADARARALPVFEAVGERRVELATPAEAQSLKLCMNQTFAAAVHALAEGAILAEKCGVGKLAFCEGIAASGLASPLLAMKATAMLESDYEPMFALALMAKDLELGGQLSSKVGAFLPVTAAVREVYRGAVGAGYGGKDYSASALFLEYTTRQ